MINFAETTVSLRWVFPFLRVTGAAPSDLESLLREGIAPKDFADPDMRVRHRVIMDLLGAAVARLRDPALGLRAGQRIEPGDFATLEYACRSSANLRESILCAGRYMYLMHGAQQARLLEDGELAMWELRVTDEVTQLPAANDFALSSALWLARQHTGGEHELREVHFMHSDATDPVAYAQIFRGARVRLGMPHNALVFARCHLDAPLRHAHAGLKTAFELHASEILARLQRAETLAGRVRRLVIEQLAAGDVDMQTIGRRVGMSVATLRRRLSEEGTSHSDILETVRRELATRYLAERKLAISEVAFLLGYRHVTAFYKAFRRWSDGTTPAEFRAEAPRV